MRLLAVGLSLKIWSGRVQFKQRCPIEILQSANTILAAAYLVQQLVDFGLYHLNAGLRRPRQLRQIDHCLFLWHSRECPVGRRQVAEFVAPSTGRKAKAADKNSLTKWAENVSERGRILTLGCLGFRWDCIRSRIRWAMRRGRWSSLWPASCAAYGKPLRLPSIRYWSSAVALPDCCTSGWPAALLVAALAHSPLRKGPASIWRYWKSKASAPAGQDCTIPWRAGRQKVGSQYSTTSPVWENHPYRLRRRAAKKEAHHALPEIQTVSGCVGFSRRPMDIVGVGTGPRPAPVHSLPRTSWEFPPEWGRPGATSSWSGWRGRVSPILAAPTRRSPGSFRSAPALRISVPARAIASRGANAWLQPLVPVSPPALSVLDAQRQQLAAEDDLALSDTAVVTNLVALYKALGGGWEAVPQQ